MPKDFFRLWELFYDKKTARKEIASLVVRQMLVFQFVLTDVAFSAL